MWKLEKKKLNLLIFDKIRFFNNFFQIKKITDKFII